MPEGTLIEPAFVTKLSEDLRRELSGAIVEYQHIRAKRYQFEVTWSGFDEMDHPERQHLVWDLAERSLENKQDILNIAMILTLGNNDLPALE